MQVPQGRTGSEPSQALAARSRRRPAPVLPPGPLPTEGIDLAAAAAKQLDWHGVVLPETVLLGRRVHLVAQLRFDVHAERIANGTGPVTDKAAVSTWTWPELEHAAPAPAVDVVGAVAVGRHWRTALAWAVPFTRYFPAAMVLPSTALLTHDYVNNCLPRARAYGIAVLSVDEAAAVTRDLEGGPDRVVPAADANSRWIDEVAYDQLLTTADVSAHVE